MNWYPATFWCSESVRACEWVWQVVHTNGTELQLAPAGGSPPRDALLHVGVAGVLAVTVGSFFAVQPLVDLARHAAGVVF